eukprot:scaffold89839_cov72-Phaeocystis_antarctica.AAC.4
MVSARARAASGTHGGRKLHGLTKFCKEGRVALVLELASRCWAYDSIRCSSSRSCAAGPRSRPTSPQSNTAQALIKP